MAAFLSNARSRFTASYSAGRSRDSRDRWNTDTGGSDDTPDGGLLKRQNPGQQGITNYIGVASVDESVVKVEKLGGKICMAKTAVPEMAYFAICQDPENNVFALWERNENAK